MIFAFKRLAGIANSRFHFGLYNDIGSRALSCYSEFAFERLAAITNSRFHIGFYSDIGFQALRCSEFEFSLLIL